MNVLVLGATSGIGESLALEFAAANSLVLCGRQSANLDELTRQCLAAGAHSVRALPCDLRQGPAPIVSAMAGKDVDLCINAASATSRLRDGELSPEQMRAYVEVDVLAPVDLALALRRNQRVPPRIVFVSSVLAGLPSPNRSVYGTLKRLHEVMLLQCAEAWPDTQVLVVRVGKALPTGPRTPETARLARFVRASLEGRRRHVTWGLSGRVLMALFHIQPLLFQGMMLLRRLLQGRTERRPAGV